MNIPRMPRSHRLWLLIAVVSLWLASVAPGARAQTKPLKPMEQTVSMESLLREMTDVEHLAKWPQAAYINREASSYDRRTVAPDQPGWFANDDFSQFIRDEEHAGRKERVMLDADGPGALVRFWLTAGRPKQGTLRIYLDRATEPSLVFNSFDLEAGPLKGLSTLLYRHESYSADAGGNTIYLPIPYAKHCKVTWEEGEHPSQRYYQINYRTYTAGTPVQTWTQEQFDKAQALVTRTGQTLGAPPQGSEGAITSLNKKLAPQATATLDLPAGSSAVRTLELLLDTGDLVGAEKEQALRSVIIQLTFDGERTVWCPATDFFGSGVGINELRNFTQSVGRDGTMRCRWVMPYQKSAKISLTNLGATPVLATLHATTSVWKWDARSMHFHANWHYEAGLKAITADKVMENTTIRDWNFNTIGGRGVYVGDSLSIYNPVATWYGEGDEKIFVDGEAFPSHMGTGTEDYYGYSYAPRGVFQTPFVNHIRIDSPMTQGVNVMGRVRPSDAIPFTKSLKFDIELISWAPTKMTYAATTYWYGLPGAASQLKPQPEAAVLPIQTLAEALTPRKLKPDAIEAEALTISGHSAGFTPEIQDMSPWDGSRWSSGKQLLGKNTKVGDFVELEIPASGNSPRQLVLHATQAKDYGTLRFSINEKASEAVFDGYAPQVQPGEAVNLGAFTPQDGKFLLRVEVSGFNPQAEGAKTQFGIDYLELLAP